MNEGKKWLAYTNPAIIPLGLGMFLSALFVAVFGGTYRNMKKILKED
jgi:hypothetical protein